MQEVTRASAQNPEVVDAAVRIVQGIDGRDVASQIRALRGWLARNVRFIPDPLIDGDVIRTPLLLLAQLARDGMIRGDCDDVATLAASLAHAIGIPARFVTVAFHGPDAPFQHVYAELLGPGGEWHEMDVTVPPGRALEPTRSAVHFALPELAGAARVDLEKLLGFLGSAIVVWKAGRRIAHMIAEDFYDV